MKDTTKLRLKRAAYWALPVGLTGAAMAWTTFAAGDLLDASAPTATAYAAAALFDAVWLYAVWADRRNHLAANPDRVPAVISWLVLLVSMGASAWHGAKAGDVASAVLGAFLPLLAKLLVWMAVKQDANQVTAEALGEIRNGRQQARDGLAKSRAAASIREDALDVHAAVQRSWKATTDRLAGGKTKMPWAKDVAKVDAPTDEVLGALLSGAALKVAGPFSPITTKPELDRADDPQYDEPQHRAVAGVSRAQDPKELPQGRVFGFAGAVRAQDVRGGAQDVTTCGNANPQDGAQDGKRAALIDLNGARMTSRADRIERVRRDRMTVAQIVAAWTVSERTAQDYRKAAGLTAA